MVLFEIWSVGKKPFSQFTNNEAMKKVQLKYNQPPPPGCPRAIYKLMHGGNLVRSLLLYITTDFTHS